jgi:hypothetical protein
MVKKSRSTKKKGGCYGGAKKGCSLLAGGRKRRASRKMKGGMYGADVNAAPIGTGAMPWGSAYSGAVDANGGAIADATDPTHAGATMAGGRRRKSRKTVKKGGRKSRKGTRKMKGGAAEVSATKAGYGFSDTSLVGRGPPIPTSTPTSGGNAF